MKMWKVKNSKATNTYYSYFIQIVYSTGFQLLNKILCILFCLKFDIPIS
jgi:hypothetical protein